MVRDSDAQKFVNVGHVAFDLLVVIAFFGHNQNLADEVVIAGVWLTIQRDFQPNAILGYWRSKQTSAGYERKKHCNKVLTLF
jgi:hypothetical protein